MGFDARLLSGIGVLTAVVEAGSFARAGQAMGLTQPAVSRAVARLEERVGIRIFNRNARSISLTDDGRRYYEMVAPLLSAIEDATMVAGSTKALVRGRLRVNVDATFGHFVLAPRINEFAELYPELSIEILVRDSIGDLVADGIDVAVRFGEAGSHTIHSELLLETRVFTCASAEYLRRHGKPQTPGDLSDGHHCVLIRDPSTGRPFTWEFQRQGEIVPFVASGRVTVNDTGSLIAACRSGAGLAQLLELYVRNTLLGGELIHVLPEWSDETFPLHAYYRRSDLMPAKLRAFLGFVREIIV